MFFLFIFTGAFILKGAAVYGERFILTSPRVSVNNNNKKKKQRGKKEKRQSPILRPSFVIIQSSFFFFELSELFHAAPNYKAHGDYTRRASIGKDAPVFTRLKRID